VSSCARGDGDGCWLPVAVGWPGFRQDLVAELQKGFESVGVETRLEHLGEPPLSLDMLRVRSRFRALEASENWLLQLADPLDEQDVRWAGDVHQLLHMRWEGFRVWTGTRPQWDVLERHLHFDQPSKRAFVGSRWLVGMSSVVDLEVFPRSAVEVLSRLPDVDLHPHQDLGDPHEWVAITTGEQDAAELQRRLDACGTRTCRFEIRSSKPRHTLLAVHAGADDLEQLEARLRAATKQVNAPWNRVWTCVPIPMIPVHRCRSSVTLALRDRIATELGAAMQCSWHPTREDHGVIEARLTDVDRVLAWLRDHPGST
jgi:hypothetical protein